MDFWPPDGLRGPPLFVLLLRLPPPVGVLAPGPFPLFPEPPVPGEEGLLLPLDDPLRLGEVIVVRRAGLRNWLAAQVDLAGDGSGNQGGAVFAQQLDGALSLGDQVVNSG